LEENPVITQTSGSPQSTASSTINAQGSSTASAGAQGGITSATPKQSKSGSRKSSCKQQ